MGEDKQLVFKTDRVTLFAYALLTFTYAVFFALVIGRSGGFSVKSLILVLLVLPVAAYFMFLSKKRVMISDKGIEVLGLMGRKSFSWDRVEGVSISPGRRYFLFITSVDGDVLVIDDSTEKFRELLEEISRRVDRSKLQQDFDKLISSYKRSYGNIYLVYIAALILLFVILKSYL